MASLVAGAASPALFHFKWTKVEVFYFGSFGDKISLHAMQDCGSKTICSWTTIDDDYFHIAPFEFDSFPWYYLQLFVSFHSCLGYRKKWHTLAIYKSDTSVYFYGMVVFRRTEVNRYEERYTILYLVWHFLTKTEGWSRELKFEMYDQSKWKGVAWTNHRTHRH